MILIWFATSIKCPSSKKNRQDYQFIKKHQERNMYRFKYVCCLYCFSLVNFCWSNYSPHTSFSRSIILIYFLVHEPDAIDLYCILTVDIEGHFIHLKKSFYFLTSLFYLKRNRVTLETVSVSINVLAFYVSIPTMASPQLIWVDFHR